MQSLIFKYILFLFAILFRFLCKYRCIQTQKIKLLELSRHCVVERYTPLCPGAFFLIKYKGESFILSPPEDLSRPFPSVARCLSVCPALCPSGRCFHVPALGITLLTSTWHCRPGTEPAFDQIDLLAESCPEWKQGTPGSWTGWGRSSRWDARIIQHCLVLCSAV